MSANQFSGVMPFEDAAGAKRGGVVAVSVYGVGDPDGTAAEVARDLDVDARGGVLAGPERRAVRPGSAGQQGPVDDVLTVDVEVVRGGHVIVEVAAIHAVTD